MSAGAAQLPDGISHGVCAVPSHKALETMHALFHSQPAPKCLVFVNSPHRAKIVCDKLWESYGVPAAPLYGEQEREEREARHAELEKIKKTTEAAEKRWVQKKELKKKDEAAKEAAKAIAEKAVKAAQKASASALVVVAANDGALIDMNCVGKQVC